MARRIVPIFIAIIVLIVILRRGESPDDAVNVHSDVDVKVDIDVDEVRDVRRERRSTTYALDVQRASWPPLVEGTAPEPTAALAAVNYYVVLDGSGSMLSKRCGGGTTKIEAAVEAVKRFFATVPADANVGLAAFDRRTIAERVPLGVNNREALNAALDKIQAGSDTPLRSSMKIGYDKLTEQARRQLGYGEYHLVVVTDGKPDPDSEDPTPLVREILHDSPVVLHTIGFCIDEDHVLNQPNRAFYASATDPDELHESLQAVLAEAPAFDAGSFR